jgi:FlaA1/EpsC-like NDP-sugar epimerase
LAARFGEIALLLGAELALAAISYSLALVALAETRGLRWVGGVLWATLGLLILCRFAALASIRLYRRSLRYASVAEFLSIIKTVSISGFFFCLFVCWQFPQLKIPIAVFVVDWAFLQLLWGGLHFGARVVKAQQAVWRSDGKRVLIVGAGDAGMALLKELALDSASGYRPVAFMDDDSGKWGQRIHGVPVIDGIMGVVKAATDLRAEEILVCIPSASPAQMRRILGALRKLSLPVRILPSLAELVAGTALRRNLRRPGIEDLLNREEFQIDVEATRKVVGGRVVLVTGAGGSIGSELCRQIAAAGPSKLLLLDKSENSLFYTNLECSDKLGANRVRPLLTDLVYRDRLHELLNRERPEIIFHAGAHKHVGLLELHPEEAIRNNVIGTRNLAEAARACGAARFVNISTDKAVSPRNYMGLSKKLTEQCVQEFARKGSTRFMNVRFGNVAGSTGSVLRLFWDQIQKGAPVRVTDPRATRYFMSVPEAVHLILRAAALGKGGETFVFEMGEPLNIYEMAKTMMRFAGLRPEQDSSIEFTGLSEGEKITEELWEEWERPVHTASAGILVIGEQDPRSRGILEKIRLMESFLARDDREGLLNYIQKIAPTFMGRRSSPSLVHPRLPEIARAARAGAA